MFTLYRFSQEPIKFDHLAKVEPEGNLIRVFYTESGKDLSALGYWLVNNWR